MTRLIRTNSENLDFVELVKHLDAYLAVKDGDDHAFYHQFNGIDKLQYVVMAYENDIAIGCGAIKNFHHSVMEIKRMFVAPASRGKGVAKKILNQLEGWALALGANACILETGKRQPEAIALYEKCGYHIISNYEPYVGMENSICFQKKLTSII